jgi:hypothetical protein
MTDNQFARALQAAGMTAFVTQLALFAGPLRQAAVAHFVDTAEGWTARACLSRTGHARRALHAGRRADAPQRIAAARLPDADRAAALAAM